MSTRSAPGPFEWVAIGLCIAGAAGLGVFVLFVAPVFLAMLRDFGGTLPAMTLLMSSPWAAVILPLPALAGPLAAAVAPRRGLRVVLLFGSLAYILAGAALFLVGVYLPVFALSESIA